MGIEGKVVVISGGEGPLGRATTRKFLSEGAKIVIGWNNPDEWSEAKGLIDDQYRKEFIDLQVDLTKEADAQKLMEKAKNEFGSIDCLLHMVGMFRAGQLIWETDTALIEQLVNVNLKSAFLCSKHAVKFMMEKGAGRVVVFPAKDAIEPKPRFGAYALSKSGLITLIQALREELKETNITANAVVFSVMDTPKTRKMPNPEPEKWVKPADVADFLCNLCADECNALSGSILKIFAGL